VGSSCAFLHGRSLPYADKKKIESIDIILDKKLTPKAH
jgi:hypothetical protein